MNKYRFLVESRANAEAITKTGIQDSDGNDVDYAVVSIRDPKSAVPNLHRSPRLISVLPLVFHDTDDDCGGRYRLMTDADAKSIYGFVATLIKGGVDTFLVHCELGICRSAGCAAALSKLFNGDDSRYFMTGGPYGSSMYRPNMFVYRKVLEAGGLSLKPIGAE
jgi:predicted protein tyrosine phosphatase